MAIIVVGIVGIALAAWIDTESDEPEFLTNAALMEDTTSKLTGIQQQLDTLPSFFWH